VLYVIIVFVHWRKEHGTTASIAAYEQQRQKNEIKLVRSIGKKKLLGYASQTWSGKVTYYRALDVSLYWWRGIKFSSSFKKSVHSYEVWYEGHSSVALLGVIGGNR